MKYKQKQKRNPMDYLSITTSLVKIIAGDDDLFKGFRKTIGLTSKQFEKYLNGVDQDKCSTVNVIELVDGEFIGVVSFPDTPGGNRLAEEHFRQCYLDNTQGGEVPSESDWTAIMDNGTYEDDNGYQLLITHSV